MSDMSVPLVALFIVTYCLVPISSYAFSFSSHELYKDKYAQISKRDCVCVKPDHITVKEPVAPNKEWLFVNRLLVPCSMPVSGSVQLSKNKNKHENRNSKTNKSSKNKETYVKYRKDDTETATHYKIEMVEFDQRMIPVGFGGKTRVFAYGAEGHPSSRHAPSFTFLTDVEKPVAVTWINRLKGQHILPVDQTLHWANPIGTSPKSGPVDTACQGDSCSQCLYTGPVPMVTHLHGGHTDDDSDGYPEAWWLPENTPFRNVGSKYKEFQAKNPLGGEPEFWRQGRATFIYRNKQTATLWVHDHTLGMTRVNVYAGPSGFFKVRTFASQLGYKTVENSDIKQGQCQGVNSALIADPPCGELTTDVVLAFQDRSFNKDNSLFYPESRNYFNTFLGGESLPDEFPFKPAPTCQDGDRSKIHPAWNPEFFGNTMLVNGRVWPEQDVYTRRYRYRLLNGCGSRFLVILLCGSTGQKVLDNTCNQVPFHVIATEQGFLSKAVLVGPDGLLIAPAERYEIVVDFRKIAQFNPAFTHVEVITTAKPVPFKAFPPQGEDIADGLDRKIMRFRIVPDNREDLSFDPANPYHQLPTAAGVGGVPTVKRIVSLIEDAPEVPAQTKCDKYDKQCQCDLIEAGPVAALLGVEIPRGFHAIVQNDPSQDYSSFSRKWSDPVSENVKVNTIEEWCVDNVTEDAHPIHVHLVAFQLTYRSPIPGLGGPLPPKSSRVIQPWERGLKDTVVAYPRARTCFKAHFDRKGLFVWHCHILEHEDNEMMLKMRVY